MPTAPFAWTHERTRVEFDGLGLTINDTHLPLDGIERLSRNLWVGSSPGSWNRLDCGVHLFADGEVTSVRFRGDAGTEEWGPWRPMWDQLVALVDDEIQPRLVDRTIARVTADSSAEVGSLRAKGRGRFTVTAASIQARRMFSKPIPWHAITDISDDALQITTVDPDGKQRKHATGLGASEWDAWQLPLLWQHYRER